MEECRAFDDDPSTSLEETALGQLRAQFPHNTELSHVLLKVHVLNKLYSTRVNDIDVETLARHIAAIGIDPILEQGSPVAVKLITECTGLRHYYSFATKFCSWHNPSKYPIYDRNVDTCLWAYRRQDSFAAFKRDGLWDYSSLITVIKAFQVHYGLMSMSLKHLDKFFYRVGGRLNSQKNP